ncbi:hypothetical protein BDZ97DRAFT_1756934 [Flammula alnicola]|nr:hypothetical protein BDZ97DRAFT_1756934 [Flammula alnicola]
MAVSSMSTEGSPPPDSSITRKIAAASSSSSAIVHSFSTSTSSFSTVVPLGASTPATADPRTTAPSSISTTSPTSSPLPSTSQSLITFRGPSCAASGAAASRACVATCAGRCRCQVIHLCSCYCIWESGFDWCRWSCRADEMLLLHLQFEPRLCLLPGPIPSTPPPGYPSMIYRVIRAAWEYVGYGKVMRKPCIKLTGGFFISSQFEDFLKQYENFGGLLITTIDSLTTTLGVRAAKSPARNAVPTTSSAAGGVVDGRLACLDGGTKGGAGADDQTTTTPALGAGG